MQAAEIDTALEETREEILSARSGGDLASAEDLERDWRRRLRRLLAADPTIADELEEIFAQARASLPEAERPSVPSVRLQAHATGNARIYQAGRDQHIVER